jgi:outer membrane protein OmpA-like peptidoglycan-associated protein
VVNIGENSMLWKFPFLFLSLCLAMESTDSHAVLHFTLTDSKQIRLEGERVVLRGQRTNIEFEGTTNHNGTFVIHIAKGETYDIFYDLLAGVQKCPNCTPIMIPFEADGVSYQSFAEPFNFKLNNVLFETGKAQLKASSYGALEGLIKGLKKNPQAIIEIQGHSDNVGGFDHNVKLSENRAQAVREYVVQQGVAASRVFYKGYGPSVPVASNDSPGGRALNRRVQVKVIAK